MQRGVISEPKSEGRACSPQMCSLIEAGDDDCDVHVAGLSDLESGTIP